MSKIDKHKQFIIDNYMNMTDRELAKHTGISKTTIQNFRVHNGLDKTKMGLETFERKPFELLVETAYKGYYISSEGRLVNLEYNYVIHSRVNQGYYRFRISYDGKYKYPMLHRLMASAFIPQNNNSQQYINHRDGDKLNSFNLLNLEWCTIGENNSHAHSTGLISYSSKVTESEVLKIIELLNKNTSVDEIACKVPNSTRNIIRHIKNKDRWKKFIHLMNW